MELLRVTEKSYKVPRGFRQPFSLEFHSAPGPVVPQGTYRLEHESLEAMELFLSPVQSKGDGFVYEAVFA